MAALPEVLMKKVDEYVDSLAPQIQPRITEELETFQTKTIDSLEQQIIDAFRGLFDKDGNGAGNRGLNDGVPDAYGGQSLPFADEIAKLTKSFGGLGGPGGVRDDLAEIFNLTSAGGGGGGGAPGGTRGFSGEGETRSRGVGGDGDGMKKFFSAAFNVVQDHLDNRNDGPGGGGQGFQLDGLLGVLSNTVKDVASNPEEKARMITPEIKQLVGAKLRDQHAPIAEQFTKIALDHIKKWLRGNTSTRDLGDGVKGEFEDQVKDLVKGLGILFGNKKHGEGTSRGIGDRAEGENGESKGGFSKIISEKLSHGLAKVHREVRLEFRKILGQIEKQLFELLPDQLQRPLEKILGGNPFDSQLDNTVSASRSGGDRGFGDDIKAKLLTKIRSLVRKVQETLRVNILGVVNGGHRKFEKESWVFVQGIVEQKVQRYLPKVKITVPDDIGNEGVSVGSPTHNIQLGGGNQPVTGAYPPPPPQQGYNSSGGQEFAPPPTQQYEQNQFPPPPTQEYHHGQPEPVPAPPQHGQQNQYPPPPQHGQQNPYPPPPQHGQQNPYPPPPQYNPQQHQSHQGQSYGYPNNDGY